MISISTTIDHLIQRANQLKVCQEQIKLITTSLTRLQHAFNETDVLINGNHSHKDMEQILKVIDAVVASCSENEADLDGVTYTDLQSLLFRLKWYLAQQEANMTDDHASKIQRLSNAYYEMQTPIENSYDEPTKQRLAEIEQQTKENTIEQLRLLREKHTETIESYLRSCVELHQSAPLTDLNACSVAKVTHTFYQISTENQVELELPLTRPFTRFERNEFRTLPGVSGEKQTSKSTWQQLLLTPYMISIAERNQCTQAKDVNEEHIIRTKRRIVILGDAGSGKSSFVRWLVHYLAQTLLLNKQHSTDYGPLRIPILIRIGELADRLKDQPSLTLFDYIGERALQDYIEQGHAMIILDGLDEISTADQRSKLLRIIENFVSTYVQIPTNASVLDNRHLSTLFDDPSRSGGNQLIVTSRIAGYHASPLPDRFAHYTIQPMNMEEIKKFVNYWFTQVHQQTLDTSGLAAPSQGENHAETLQTDLEKPENAGLLQLASNPALLSIICSMTFHQLDDTPLPIQRILLYEQIANSQLNLCSSRQSTIPKEKLIRMLSHIAFYIYKYAPSNVLDEEEMKDVCFQSVKTFKNKLLLTSADIDELEDQAAEFARMIRENVGLLTSRDGSLYGFLHSTVQDYFTCLELAEMDPSMQTNRQKQTQLIVRSLHHHLNNRRFRAPIALALGQISATWSQKDFDDLCHTFIQQQNDSDSLLPLGAYMLISSNPDLVRYPSNDIFFAALDQLMITAGEHRWSVTCPFLFDQLTNALRKLRSDIVSLWINNFLQHCSTHDTQTITALCHLIEGKPHEFENIKWLDQSACTIFQSISALDNEMNGFAIDRLLVKVVFSNHQLLPTKQATFKEFLVNGNIPAHSIPVTLLPFIIILYGGLKRDGQTVLFDPSYIHRESAIITPILIRFLSVTDHARQDQAFKKLRQDCIKAFLAQIENHDQSCETVDLCIVTLCLYGLEYIQDNITIIPSALLRMTMDRLKYISMILRQFYFTGDEDDRRIENDTTRLISIAIETFQYGESARVQFLDLLNCFKGGIARLRSSNTSILLEGESKRDKRVTLNLPNSLRKENGFLDGLLSTDTHILSERSSCSLLPHFTKLFWILEHNDELDTQYRMAVALDSTPDYLVFRHDEDVLSSLVFIPPHLQNLYLRLLQQKMITIKSLDRNENQNHCLYFGHILTECLMLLSNASCKRLTILAAVIALLPWLRIHQLENFGSSLLWALATKDLDLLAIVESQKQRPINDETGQYLDTVENIFGGDSIRDERRRNLIRDHIKEEHQRLQNARTGNDGRNMKLFSASTSLAHICRWSEEERRLSLLNESVQGAMLITNKLTRLDALCLIALHTHSDHDSIQLGTGRSIQEEIEHQFNDIYSTLPLLLHTAIFIRCLPLLRHQQKIDQCLQNLFDKFADNDQRDQQAVNEALLPYLQSNALHYLSDHSRIVHNRCSSVKKYFNITTDQNSTFSVLISNMYVVELAKDFYECLKTDVRQFTTDESIVTTLCLFKKSILTETQAIVITNILSSADRLQQTENLRLVLNNALHRISSIEFKARPLLERWLKWKDSNELSSFAFHAALLLTNSDFWSVEATTVICDLLCSENDRFRRRAEIIFRSSSDYDARTSSKLGMDVLLVLTKKKAHYQFTSAFAKLTMTRISGNMIVDVQSHLETFLWLERYRIHALFNKEYSLNQPRLWTTSYITSYFTDDSMINAGSCIDLFRLSGDLIIYMCDMIAYGFSPFLEIDQDTTSDAVVESHNQFVVTVLVTFCHIVNHTEFTRGLAVDALKDLFRVSYNDDIRRAVAYALGYVCDEKTYKSLYRRIQTVANDGNNVTTDSSNRVLAALISSYSYCICTNDIASDQDDLDLFSNLINHLSEEVVKAVRTGYGRVLRDTSFLLGILGVDYLQCYYALTRSTAYLFIYDIQLNSENAAAEFIEQNPILLSIFIVELYDSIRHFTDSVIPIGDTNYDLAYGRPQYVKIASLIAQRIPAVFCAYVKNWPDGGKLKRALFYTSKQHSFPQRAACLTILSMFGELTVELCEMLIEAIHDDPHVQNTSYKCLARLNAITDEKIVLNLLFSYLKSKSMNTRYVAAKILLQLCKSSLISFKQVRTILNGVMLDPHSDEDLYLIVEQENIFPHCLYYYAGPLKDAIYSLIVQHLTAEISGNVRRNEWNDIDLNFIQSEEAARVASCLYEAKTEPDEAEAQPPAPDHHVGVDPDAASLSSSLNEDELNED